MADTTRTEVSTEIANVVDDPLAPLAVIDRRDGEQVRITASEYHGATYVDLRLWWRTPAGGWVATKKGITVPVDAVDTIVTALRKAKAAR